ncbi:MAG: helix-turn-helix domain-containing protein, partial [Bacteroidota bacterium]
SKDFSMHEIAVAMDAPIHHISYCLNQIMQTNFANLKNRLRVEYSILLMKQNESSTLSIEGIAQNSGFSTRSSFYSAFKNVTGTTPTEFLQKEKSPQQ